MNTKEAFKGHNEILGSAMDPFKDCRRFYKEHFSDRMQERYLPHEQVDVALKEGRKIQERKGEYLVKWNRWTISVSVGSCHLILNTAFRN